MIFTILILIILFVVLVSIMSRYFVTEYVENAENVNILNDGFLVMDNMLTPKQITKFSELAKNGEYIKIKEEIMNSPYINERISQTLGPDYKFMDYVWMIMKSNVHTCHRDNNGMFFNPSQKHHSYTILFYLEDMESCLDVVPKSHKNQYEHAINWTDVTQKLKCNPGSAVLFNANLVHTGSFNKKPDNMRIQMKITHKDDFDSIKYYQNFNKYANKSNNVPLSLRQIQKHITCQYPFLSDVSQGTNIETARGSSDGAEIPLSQKLFSLVAYGDSNYYDLPDAEK